MKRSKGLVWSTEIIVAIVVFILIGSAFIMNNHIKSVNLADAETRINMLGAAHTVYYLEKGSFATDATLMSEGYLKDSKMWNGTKMIDPWKNPIEKTETNGILTIQLSAASQAQAGKNIIFKVQ